MNTLKTQIIAGILACVFTNCSKEKEPIKSLQGTWELTKTYGGGVAGENTFSAGNGNTFVFGITDFRQFEDGRLRRQGIYTITADTIRYFGATEGGWNTVLDKLNLYSTDTTYHRIYRNKSELILDYTSAAHDGIEKVYRKIN